METQIITNGTNAFGLIIDKMTSITGEFTPYILYIGIALMSITLTIHVVKNILGYLKGGAMNTIEESREQRKYKKFIGMRNRRNRRRRNRRHRNRPTRYNKIRYRTNER